MGHKRARRPRPVTARCAAGAPPPAISCLGAFRSPAHGDFHPLNILGDISDPVIIDWLDARRGDPAADVCRSYLLLKLHAAEIAMPYLDAYCRLGDMVGDAVLRWMPYVAAAKLAEGVPSERAGLLEIVCSSPTRAASST